MEFHSNNNKHKDKQKYRTSYPYNLKKINNNIDLLSSTIQHSVQTITSAVHIIFNSIKLDAFNK